MIKIRDLVELEGIFDLPLHTGKVPPWLATVMRRLSRAIIDVMVIEWGPDKVVERLTNPLWFQAFNNAIGMDWDSSGSTTVTLGILKEVVDPLEHGFMILGGKGEKAREVPNEALRAQELLGVDSNALIRLSKLVAKGDTVVIQDGHTLYHHSFLISESGKWAVIQQGMNLSTKLARRYHWQGTLGSNGSELVSGFKQDFAIDASQNEGLKKLIVDLVNEQPSKVISEYKKAKAMLSGNVPIEFYARGYEVKLSKNLRLIYGKPIDEKKVYEVLKGLYEVKPRNLEEVLLNGIGPSTARALYLISDLIYNEPPSYDDPVKVPYDPLKYALAHGGKDGAPIPVNRKIAYEIIHTLEEIIERAKLERHNKEAALRKLRELHSGRAEEGA